MSEPIYVDAGDAVSLIASAQTGVFYTNQTGGVACNHPAMEGFLVPLGQIAIDACWAAWDDGPIPEEIALRVERTIAHAMQYGDMRDFKIDRDALHQEAWIRCSWTMRTGEEWGDEASRRAFAGVLTYQNCD